MSEREKVLVTGATGFLGRHVLEALKATRPQVKVVVLVRSQKDWHGAEWTQEHADAEVIEGSLTDCASWHSNKSLKGLKKVLHLAAQVHHSRHNTEAMLKTNVEGTERMVQLCAKLGAHLTFVSSSGTVGCFKKPGQFAYEDAPYATLTAGKWPYYESKIQAEKRAFQLANELGVKLTVIRPPVLLGPGDHKFRSTGYVLKHLRQQFPFLLSGGMHFVDVRDAASAIVKAAWHPSARPIYHLSGTMIEIEQFFKMCEDVSGVPAPKRILNPSLALILAKSAEKVATKLKQKSPLPDPVVIEMAGHHWGLKSRYAEVELEFQTRGAYQTLADTVTWVKQNHPSFKT